MLRVTELETSGKLVLRLEGKLVGPWVSELAEACAKTGACGTPHALDLHEVTYADSQGVGLLRQLLSAGYELQGCPPLLCEELKC